MSDKTIPFPQANDFNRIVSIVCTPESDADLSVNKASILGDLTSRQCDYYINACKYLGLLDDDEHYTPLAESIREESDENKVVSFSHLIISDPVIGKLYTYHKVRGAEVNVTNAAHILARNVVLGSDAVYWRRASTMVSWVRWVLAQEKACEEALKKTA